MIEADLMLRHVPLLRWTHFPGGIHPVEAQNSIGLQLRPPAAFRPAPVGGFKAGFPEKIRYFHANAMPPVRFQNLNAGLMPFQSRAPESSTGFYVYVSANLGSVGSTERRAIPARVPKPLSSPPPGVCAQCNGLCRVKNCVDPVLQRRVAGPVHLVQVFAGDTGFDQPPRRRVFVRQRIPVAIARDETLGFVQRDCFFVLRNIHSAAKLSINSSQAPYSQRDNTLFRQI